MLLKDRPKLFCVWSKIKRCTRSHRIPFIAFLSLRVAPEVNSFRETNCCSGRCQLFEPEGVGTGTCYQDCLRTVSCCNFVKQLVDKSNKDSLVVWGVQEYSSRPCFAQAVVFDCKVVSCLDDSVRQFTRGRV